MTRNKKQEIKPEIILQLFPVSHQNQLSVKCLVNLSIKDNNCSILMNGLETLNLC